MKRYFVILSVLTLISAQIGSLASPALAAGYEIPAADLANGFNPNAILTDDDIFDVTRMDLASIRAFLKAHGSLNSIRVVDIDGVEKEPAEVIWRVANSYRINPQYLLVLLQKEQSLVETKNITQRALDWATGFGVCDSCAKDDPRIQDFKGFANQLDYAAKQHRERYYMQLLGRGTTISGHAPGKTVLISGSAVTPVNNATAMLYTYTPHIHGNLNLWRIWQRWFSLTLPDGTIAQTDDGQIYLIRFGTKKPFASKMVAYSMIDSSKIIQVSTSDLISYPTGESIEYPNYSIVETPSGKLYLLTDGKKRLIKSQDVFRKLGFITDDIIVIEDENLSSYELGADISSEKQYPTGLLVQDPKKNYWYVQDDTKQRIADPALLGIYFKGRKAKILDQATVDSYKTIAPYALRDGELVRSVTHPAVYVVELGKLRPIVSGEVFERVGWQWRNVVVVSDAFVANAEKGKAFTLDTAPAEAPPAEEASLTISTITNN
ncbi:MAG: hypothetical protein KC585_00010 [Candidatus Magasanikbacteria bacterium]|nr:hypothetical protein [Candidatus Magasanikbacteria bacterium]